MNGKDKALQRSGKLIRSCSKGEIMNRFCVIANMEKSNAAMFAKQIKEYLERKKCVCKIIKNECVEENGNRFYTDVNEIPADTECIIVLGGDGTMIQAAKDTGDLGIPLYGINIGGVGFLTESETDSMWDNFDKLIKDEHRIESRIMLEAFIPGKDNRDYALNDVAILKREYGKLIKFEVYINGELLDSFFADGIIISTPTGSTGYNLSAGGPVISPSVNALVVTPVCPHSLNDRSFVIDGDDVIDIKLLEGKNSHTDSAVISVDGRMFDTIESGQVFRMKKSSKETGIVLTQKTNFYHKMRSKLCTHGISSGSVL